LIVEFIFSPFPKIFTKNSSHWHVNDNAEGFKSASFPENITIGPFTGRIMTIAEEIPLTSTAGRLGIKSLV
jgi:hypothetical protein